MQKRISLNKKAQDLSIGTLILIVLGIIVLVLLILGFSMGWSNLWNKINVFRGGSSVGDVATACKLAANSDDKYTYCQDFKKIKDANGDVEYLNCQDTRIDPSLDKKLTCTGAYENLQKSADAYCDSITGSLKKGDKVTINNQHYEIDELPGPQITLTCKKI